MYNYSDYKMEESKNKTEESETSRHLAVYISQPMTDRDLKEIELMRNFAEAYIRNNISTNMVVEFINGYEESWGPKYMKPIKALAYSIQVLADADVVYFCPGWELSKGCRVERHCCQLYDIPIEYIK